MIRLLCAVIALLLSPAYCHAETSLPEKLEAKIQRLANYKLAVERNVGIFKDDIETKVVPENEDPDIRLQYRNLKHASDTVINRMIAEINEIPKVITADSYQAEFAAVDERTKDFQTRIDNVYSRHYPSGVPRHTGIDKIAMVITAIYGVYEIMKDVIEIANDRAMKNELIRRLESVRLAHYEKVPIPLRQFHESP